MATTGETTGGMRVLSLAEAIAEVEEVVHETERAYLAAENGGRQSMARRLLALDIARQALAIAKLDEERRLRRAQRGGGA